MRAGMCAGERGAPRSTDRTGGGVVRCSGVPGGGDGGWGRGVRRGSVPRVSCPKRASPQTPPYAQGGDPSVRPPRKAKLSTPRRDRSPGEDPARRGNGTNPKTSKRAVEPPRPPAGAGSPPPHPRAGGSGGLGWGRGGGGGKKPSPESMLNRSGEEGGKLRWLPAGLSSSAQPGEQFFLRS